MKEKKIQLREKDHAHRKENIWAKEVFSNGQQSLKSIMGSSPIPAFIIGKDHLIIYWNKALEELSGIKAQEVVGTGQHWRAFYKTARPCMADLLVERRQKDIRKWYGEKFIRSRLIAGAYEATDFFPELGKKENGCVLQRLPFAMPGVPLSVRWKPLKILPTGRELKRHC